MKATGIVRRIDDLGRVVIPKEIRRSLRIRQGDPLEIFVDRDGEVILKKYSPVGELSDFAQEYVDSLSESTGHIALITDRDTVVAAAGIPKRNWQEKEIPALVLKVMDARRSLILPSAGQADPKEIGWDFTSCVLAPIIAEGDSVGTVVLGSQDEKVRMTVMEQKLAETAASFLAKQIEQ